MRKKKRGVSVENNKSAANINSSVETAPNCINNSLCLSYSLNINTVWPPGTVCLLLWRRSLLTRPSSHRTANPYWVTWTHAMRPNQSAKVQCLFPWIKPNDPSSNDFWLLKVSIRSAEIKHDSVHVNIVKPNDGSYCNGKNSAQHEPINLRKTCNVCNLC